MADYSDPLGLLFGGVDYFGSPQKSQGLLQLTPQEIERMAAAQSPAFGVFPQMQPYRSQQDITASANVPVDVARGRVAGTLGLFGDVFNQPIPMVRPLQLLSQAMTGQQKYPDTEYFLENLPLKSDTPVGDVAGKIGSFAPINPMPAVRGAQKLGGLLGEEMATRLNTGRPILPSLLAEPQTAMFAVEPNPSMAIADESSAMRQQLTDKMQALLAQKKIATSAVDVGSINQQIGELQAQFKSLPAMGRVAREVVVPEITAPVSNLGFYSATEQAAMNLERSKGTGQSFLNDLMNAPDVKNYEIEAMGLDTYLKGKPNVTRQEVQDFIQNNKVDVQEVRKSNTANTYTALGDDADGYFVYDPDGSREVAGPFKTLYEAEDKADRLTLGAAPQYEKYQLGGGENYRELVLTLPENMSEYNKYVKTLRDKYGQGGFNNLPLTDIERARLDKFYAAEELDPYKSSHFPDIANPLAHLRVNDRIDAEGKKMLLIEEVQSDWHQAGREKGYKTKESLEKWYNQNKLDNDPAFADLNSEQRSVIERNRSAGMGGDNAVPDAPFKDTWYQLALKRAIKEAVDKGYDRIGLTTGKRQIERYTDELRQNVDEINFNPIGTQNKIIVNAKKDGQNTFSGTVKNGKFIEGPDKALGKTLEEVLGKTIAKQIEEKKDGVIKGKDLTIGGEGMKKYYDEVYPNYLEKYGKKYGAQVGETYINANAKAQTKDQLAKELYGNNETYKNLPSEQKRKVDVMFMDMAKEEKIRYLDITPEMKKAVQKGQPLAAVEGMTGLLA